MTTNYLPDTTLSALSSTSIKTNNPEWSISILKGRDLFSLESQENVTPIITVNSITDLKARFVADPFIVREADIYYLFFEVMNVFATGEKGEIGCASSYDLINWRYQGIVLKKDFHLSYPFVFKTEDQYWMIPESKQANCVTLYQAVDFPTKWREVKCLIRGRLRDSTVFYHDGLWWMISLMRGYSMVIHYAKNIFGPWKAHFPRSVYYYNKQRARPAGRVIEYNSKLIRFSQDNSSGYGAGGVRAFSIEKLSRWRFKERACSDRALLYPAGQSWCAVGMHHIDALRIAENSWIAAVDGCGWIDR